MRASEGDYAFQIIALALLDWASMIDDFKKNDAAIVRNSIPIRWITVRSEFVKNLKGEEVVSQMGWINIVFLPIGYLGIDNIARTPSSHLSNVKLPPCCSAIVDTMARPIPVPFMFFAFFPLLNGTVNCFKFSTGSLSP